MYRFQYLSRQDWIWCIKVYNFSLFLPCQFQDVNSFETLIPHYKHSNYNGFCLSEWSCVNHVELKFHLHGHDLFCRDSSYILMSNDADNWQRLYKNKLKVLVDGDLFCMLLVFSSCVHYFYSRNRMFVCNCGDNMMDHLYTLPGAI